MQRINHNCIYLFIVTLSISCPSFAETDPECIKHLGGAFSGVECYNGLSTDLEIKNRQLVQKLLVAIPKNHSDRSLLKKYETTAKASERFCSLSKNIYAKWQLEANSKNPRYFDYDVVYYECIYNQKLEQNNFLNSLYKYSEEN
ncbi:MAG: hypothetical protein H6R13_2215 [Proteobacteria bacterium]|nr:hypothetical protein [Pseudomonadota bacterium]